MSHTAQILLFLRDGGGGDTRLYWPERSVDTKAVSTRHFSEPGAIDRDQFAPSCPCPHGSNRNARSGF